jgi:subtilisin family serine protease
MSICQSDPQAPAGDGLDEQHPIWLRRELGNATGKGIVVGVVDSGWDYTLADPRIGMGVAFADASDARRLQYSRDAQDRHGHGTACTSILLDVAPDVRIQPIRVFGTRLETSNQVLEAAVTWAAEQGLRLLNMSLGTQFRRGARDLYIACEQARRRGTIIVASAHRRNPFSFPACFDNVIGVTAADVPTALHYEYHEGQPAECATRSFYRYATGLQGKKRMTFGTSLAAPGISGVVALLLERFPDASLDEVRQLLNRYAHKRSVALFRSDVM